MKDIRKQNYDYGNLIPCSMNTAIQLYFDNVVRVYKINDDDSKELLEYYNDLKPLKKEDYFGFEI